MKLTIVCLLVILCFHYTAVAQKKAVTVDHIAIHVRNLDSSTKFYEKYFHFDTLPNPFPKYPVRWFRINEQTQLHMVQGLDKPVSLPPLSHFCLSISSFDTFVETLVRDNITYYDGLGTPNKMTVRGDGVKQVLFKDPDSYWIEVNNANH